jgi:hypothetical protein
MSRLKRQRVRGGDSLLAGPAFSTRQITALVVAILLAVVLVPVGAQAAQVVSAIITDPGGTNKAHVDANGNLQVGGTVDVGNMPSVTVANTATVQAAIPAGAFSVVLTTTGAGQVVSGPDPAGTNYAITSVTFRNGGSSPELGTLDGFYGATIADCLSGAYQTVFGPRAVIPPGDTVHLSFPQPFVIKAASAGAACLLQGGNVASTVVGYKF